MKTIQTIVFTSLILLSIIACKSETEKLTTEVELEETEETVIEEEVISFNETLTFGKVSFDVKTIGEGSLRQLYVKPNGLEIDNQTLVNEINGQVHKVEIEDLNADGFPELLVYTVSTGSGSYGEVIAYSVNNGKSVSFISFPDLDENEKAFEGYMGHDEFVIVNKKLTRKFPIYKSDDINSKPTGGTRLIQYKLVNGEASRLFEIENVKDLK